MTQDHSSAPSPTTAGGRTLIDIPSSIPRYNRALVPWVTRWTGEVVREPYRAMPDVFNDGAGFRLFYENPNVPAMVDGRGVLWQAEGIGRNGKPLFADVNSHRQRLAMHKMLCQICGRPITERPITSWLMTNEQWTPNDDGRFLTANPPTCRTCEPIALAYCPHLRDAKAHGVIVERVTVRDWRRFGVRGERVMPDGRRVNHALYQYGTPGRRSVLAKQAVVEIVIAKRERIA